jgi:hypothetical protein
MLFVFALEAGCGGLENNFHFFLAPFPLLVFIILLMHNGGQASQMMFFLPFKLPLFEKKLSISFVTLL